MAVAPSTAPTTGGGGGILGTIVKALPTITKGVGAIRDIFNVATNTPGGAGFLNSEFVKESTKQLQAEQERVYGQIQDVLAELLD